MNPALSGTNNRGSGVSHRVADEVRAWLGRRRITAREASRQLDWSQAYLSHRLTGRRPFTVEDLDQLAQLLDVSLAAFFDFRDESYESYSELSRNRGFRTRKDSDFVAGDVPLETVAA